FTTQNRRYYPLAKIIGKRSGHQMLASTPASILNHKTDKSGIPSIPSSREPLYCQRHFSFFPNGPLREVVLELFLPLK
ncbi:hypothetical protein H0241_34965, partial [Mesorhizobium sp. CCANP35]|nr:hypothetical protein [Mesorhizobium neociceri]